MALWPERWIFCKYCIDIDCGQWGGVGNAVFLSNQDFIFYWGPPGKRGHIFWPAEFWHHSGGSNTVLWLWSLELRANPPSVFFALKLCGPRQSLLNANGRIRGNRGTFKSREMKIWQSIQNKPHFEEKSFLLLTKAQHDFLSLILRRKAIARAQI